MRRFALLALMALATPASGAPCGGDFPAFLKAMGTEAAALGLPDAAIRAVLDGAQLDPAVIKADHAQGIFRKTFIDFSTALISKNRITRPLMQPSRNSASHAGLFWLFGHLKPTSVRCRATLTRVTPC
jgi:membrane-bound lytic murein transglycosylase B